MVTESGAYECATLFYPLFLSPPPQRTVPQKDVHSFSRVAEREAVETRRGTRGGGDGIR